MFENLEARSNRIYNVDVLTAMRWPKKEWKNCPMTVIKNCFKHCYRRNVEETAENSVYNEQETLPSMVRDGLEHSIELTTSNAFQILNPTVENDVTEKVCLDELAKQVADLSDCKSGSEK